MNRSFDVTRQVDVQQALVNNASEDDTSGFLALRAPLNDSQCAHELS
jgi:hypothetical protein